MDWIFIIFKIDLLPNYTYLNRIIHIHGVWYIITNGRNNYWSHNNVKVWANTLSP